MMSVLLAVTAATLLALACTVEQDSAQRRPPREALKLRLLTRLARDPRWLFGMGLATVSLPIQAAALGLGSLVVVEPIIAAGIALAIPMQWVVSRRRPRRRDILLATVMAAALATFLIAAQVAGAKQDGEPFEWLLAGGVAALAAVGLAAAATRRQGRVRAGLLGTAAGALFGVQSALLKATVSGLAHGILHAGADWHLYALILTGATALVLEQSAYQAGALAASVGGTKLMAAVTAVALGLLLFDERATSSGIRLVIAFVALAVAFLALAALSWGQPPAERQSALSINGGGGGQHVG